MFPYYAASVHTYILAGDFADRPLVRTLSLPGLFQDILCVLKSPIPMPLPSNTSYWAAYAITEQRPRMEQLLVITPRMFCIKAEYTLTMVCGILGGWKK